MMSVLWVGTAVGAVLGLLHAGYVYRNLAMPDGSVARVRAGYYALFTFFLWLLFGTYVLVLWVVAVIAYAIARLFQWRI